MFTIELLYRRSETKNHGITTRHFVLPRPLEDRKIVLRIDSSIKKMEKSRNVHALTSMVTRSLLTKIQARIVFRGYRKGVSQDFKIWENKKNILNVPLANVDDPILLFRK